MAIIISENGKNAKKLETASFELEDKLQQYIYDNPESVPVYDIREDIRLLILAREFPTNSGPIDALGVDQEGSHQQFRHADGKAKSLLKQCFRSNYLCTDKWSDCMIMKSGKS